MADLMTLEVECNWDDTTKRALLYTLGYYVNQAPHFIFG